MALPKPNPIVPPRRRARVAANAAAGRRLQIAASAVVLLAGLAWAHAVHAETIMQQVFEVEARYGNDPGDVITHLRDLEVPARASGGDDLRAFLAAWGYAHAARSEEHTSELQSQ